MNIVDLLFPKKCVGCAREGAYICQDCVRKLAQPEAICPMCCKPSLDGWVHARCRTSRGMERLFVGLPYRGMVQQLLKKVKYKNSWDIIEFLFALCDFPQLQDCIVTSVPMFAQKERERGFNQAELVAKLLAQHYKVPNLVILERTRATQPMFGLTKIERQKNIQGAFRVIDTYTHMPASRQGGSMNQRIILVDDVWTTGATMRECARILKHGGAREVWGLTLAR